MSLGVEPRPRGTTAKNAFSFSGLPKNRSDLVGQSAQRHHLSVLQRDLQAGIQANDRADGVEADVVFGVLDGHRLRCIDDGGLRRVVPRQTRSWSDTSRRCNRDLPGNVMYQPESRR